MSVIEYESAFALYRTALDEFQAAMFALTVRIEHRSEPLDAELLREERARNRLVTARRRLWLTHRSPC